jgi:3-phenylpropionate/trans-cinnamate dioxygenase ferredoxin reductase component
MPLRPKLVVVGAGHAAGHLLSVLLREKYPGPITLIGRERELPYQRPPLSKAYLHDPNFDHARLHLLPAHLWAEDGLTRILGTDAITIERANRQVRLGDGRLVPYDRLVLATGALPRRLPVPGACLPGVHMLRSLSDAQGLRAELAAAGSRVVVVGGGFVGLEIASAAVKFGRPITVLETTDRLLGRVASPITAGFFAATHRQRGVDLRFGVQVTAIEGSKRATVVRLQSGETIEAGLVVVGVGADPETRLAAEAGLVIDRGIVVDLDSRTNDPDILAIGDCTAGSKWGGIGRTRLESVQNAMDQAAAAADTLLGRPPPTCPPVPWFWTEQHDMKLQIVGISEPSDEALLRGDPAAGSFTEIRLREGLVTAVAAINRPTDFTFARRALAGGPAAGNRALLRDVAVPLAKAF